MVKKAKKTKTMTKMVRMGSHQDENGMAQARAGKGGKTFGRFMASLLAVSLGVAALAPALSARTAWADSAVASQVQAAGQAQEQTQGQGQEPTRPSNQVQGEVQGQTLPQTVATSVPNDAVVVSPTLAASPDGTVYQTRTGRKVSAQEAESVAGTSAVPADPLSKTGGDSFIPVEVSELRQSQQNGQQGSQPNSQQNNQPSSFEASALVVRKKPAKTSRTINPSAWASGPYWGSANGTPAFYNANGSLFAQRAKRVIDVSSWQGNVDWAAVKAAGIQGAIIRIGYGNDIADSKAQRNISECRRLGIPFGLYHYSYAYNASFAAAEGESVARFLKRYGVSVKDLAYPIYYDLEAWSWSEHTRPSDPATYRGIVNAFYAALTKAGYGSRLGVYSYTSYLTTALNDSSIHQKTSWVAQYGANMGFTGLTSDFRGWQYSSQGTVKGVSGSVDLNAFGYSTAASSESSGSSSNQGRGINMARLPIVTVPNGIYYVNVQQKDSVSLDVNAGSRANGQAMQIYRWNNSTAQRFRFTRQWDGSYVITNVNSGKALDVSGSRTYDRAKVQQWSVNGAAAQRWFIRDASDGYYLQSALGNWVLDMANGSTADFTSVRLFTPNGTKAQKFQLASAINLPQGRAMRISSDVDPGRVIDIPSGSRADSTRAQLYSWLGGSAQLYTFRQVGNGVYTMTNINSGKVLEVAGAGSANGSVVQQHSSNGGANQHWQLRSATGASSGASASSAFSSLGFVGSGSGKYLDLPAGRATNGVGLQIWQNTNASAQRWTVSEARTGAALAYDHRGDLPDGTYTFGAGADSSYKLDLSGGSRKAGANIQVWKSNGAAAQRWRVTHDRDGYVVLTSAVSGLSADVAGGRLASGTNVRQWYVNGAGAQRWVAVRNANGSYTFISALRASSSSTEAYALDLANGSAASGTNVRLWKANGSRAQQWWAGK